MKIAGKDDISLLQFLFHGFYIPLFLLQVILHIIKLYGKKPQNPQNSWEICSNADRYILWRYLNASTHHRVNKVFLHFVVFSFNKSHTLFLIFFFFIRFQARLARTSLCAVFSIVGMHYKKKTATNTKVALYSSNSSSCCVKFNSTKESHCLNALR